MDDLISRKAALNAPVTMVSDGLEWIPAHHIKDLPSAQPEIIRCKDCKYRGVTNYCIYDTRLAWVTKSNDFCNKAERKENEP